MAQKSAIPGRDACLSAMDDSITTGMETAVSLPGQQMIRTANQVNKGTQEPLVNYRPHFFLRNGNVQTILSRLIRPDAHLVTRGEQMLLLDAGPDHTGFDPGRSVRLLGFYTPGRLGPDAGEPRGLAMLLHGWEGDSHSAYNLSMGSALVRAGYDVLRLNMRDHGPTHHLNRGLFYATLVQEIHAAAQQAGLLAGRRPFFLIGASLGANFVVRMALRNARDPIPNLGRAVAVNPVLNPQRTCTLLDQHAFLRPYFRNCWLKSLQKKQHLFPDLYDFSALESIPTIREMSDWLIKQSDRYINVDEYLNAYSVRPSDIANLSVPLSILTAANDPIIPPGDIAALPSHPLLRVNVLQYGGHVGYNDLFPLHSRLPELVVPLLEQDNCTD